MAAAADAPARGEVARVDAAWNALGIGDAGLRRRHDAAHASLRDAAERRRRAGRRARFDGWLAHFLLVRAHERDERDAEATRDALAKLPVLDLAADAMRERSEMLAPETNDVDALRDAVIELERFAGIDSPATDRQRRMDLQVGQLSARLRGERVQGPEQQLESVLVRITGSGRFPADSVDLDARIERALSHALDQLG